MQSEETTSFHKCGQNSRHSKLFCCLVLLLFQEAAGCQYGWFPGNGKCYYFSRDSTNFFSAMSFCNLYGAKLVEIDNAYKYNEIKRLVNQRHIPYFWIGLTDLFYEGSWVKVSSLTSQPFFRWYPGEPSNSGYIEHCGVWYTNNIDLWNDAPCHDNHYFICEQ